MTFILPMAFLLGAIIGWRRARKLGGNNLDKLQYGAAFGIAFLLLALVITLLAISFGILQ